MPNQLGKRYGCSKCGTEVLCTKNGDGVAQCCSVDMQIKKPKALPSGD